MQRNNIALISSIGLRTKIISRFQLQRYQLRIIQRYSRNFLDSKTSSESSSLKRSIHRMRVSHGLWRTSKTYLRKMIFLVTLIAGPSKSWTVLTLPYKVMLTSATEPSSAVPWSRENDKSHQFPPTTNSSHEEASHKPLNREFQT